MKHKVAVFASFGPESKVYERCAKNWLLYSGYYPEIDFYLFGESSAIPLWQVEPHLDHLLVGVPDLSSTGYDKQYRQTYSWSREACEKGNRKYKAIFSYLSTLRFQYDFYYQVNITALVSLSKLQKIARLFPRNNFYAGYPIFFKDRERFFVCGSNIIYSNDVFNRLSQRSSTEDPVVDSPEFRAADIWWSMLLSDQRITALPMSVVSFRDQRISGDTQLLLEALNARLSEGHFQFRFKNEIKPSERELIDPAMQAYAMAAMLLQDDRSLVTSLDLISDFGKTWHLNVTAVGTNL